MCFMVWSEVLRCIRLQKGFLSAVVIIDSKKVQGWMDGRGQWIVQQFHFFRSIYIHIRCKSILPKRTRELAERDASVRSVFGSGDEDRVIQRRLQKRKWFLCRSDGILDHRITKNIINSFPLDNQSRQRFEEICRPPSFPFRASLQDRPCTRRCCPSSDGPPV